MYAFDNRKHHKPHIYAEYSGKKVVVDIETGEILDGDFPPKKMKLIQAWIEIHSEDLLADWNIAIAGGEIFKIDPLR
jgi:desulfoferrodoxin (superoxide reductase-like protein)